MSPSIILTASQADYDESLPGFLHQHPVPFDIDGNPIMSEGAWVKEQLKDWYFREAHWGLKKIAGELVTLKKVFE